MAQEKENVAIVGLGVISRFYLEALKNNSKFNLLAVCDIDSSEKASYNDRNIAFFEDYSELLREKQISSIILNLPNHLHYQISKESLESGKNVCCEKPLTNDLADANKLKEIAKQTNLTLFTAFHRRYNINIIQLKEELNSTTLSIKKIDAFYLEYIKEHCGRDLWYLNPSLCGGGCVADNGPNVFDTLTYLFGPLEISSANLSKNSDGIDIQAKIVCHALGKVPINVHLDWEYREGEKKEIQIEFSDNSILHVDMLNGFSAFKSSLYHEYVGVLNDFYRKLRSNNSHGEEGIEAFRLVKNVYEIGSS